VKKIICRRYFQYYDHKSFDDAFHGTHFDNLQSILKNGLHRPGEMIEGKALEIV
jgi:hypothetical protein